jgi:hypothetical protein
MHRKLTHNYEITDLEVLLDSTLQPVKPRPEYVNDLRKRLLDPTVPSITMPADKAGQYLILALASGIGGVFVVVMNLRAMLSFLSALGVLQLIKRQLEQKRVASTGPVA